MLSQNGPREAMADRPSNPSNKPATRSEPGGQLFQRLSAELASERELSAEEAELRAELARLEARLARAEQATERCGQLGEELEQLRPRLGYEFNLPSDASLAIIGQLGAARCRAARACQGLRAAVGSAVRLGAFRHRVLAVCANGYEGIDEDEDGQEDEVADGGHTVVCTRDAVFSFGDGRRGQLGHHHALLATGVPRVVTALLDQDVVAAAASEYSTLVCSDQGKAYWFGELARVFDEDGNMIHRRARVPRLVEGLERVVGVAAGRGHLLAWIRGGELYAWGGGMFGQLGHGGEEDEAAPRLVEALAGSTVVGADGGEFHSVVRTASGRVYTFGYGSERLGHGEDEPHQQSTPRMVEALAGSMVVAVSAGGDVTAAVTQAGGLYTWGYNIEEVGWGTEEGSVGHGPGHENATVDLPRLVAGLAGKSVAGVSVGSGHAMAWTDSGELYSWGYSGVGQLGHDSTMHRSSPHRVEALASKAVVRAAAGYAHSVIVTRDQKVYTCGWGCSGQLGHGAFSPTTLALVPTEVKGLLTTPLDAAAVRALKVVELRAALSKRGLPTKGLKAVLVDRLLTALGLPV